LISLRPSAACCFYFMKLLKTFLAVTLFCLSQVAYAQVSNGEGFAPMEGVVISKARPVQSVTPGAVFKDCDDCPEMVVIPAGQFVMGGSPGEDEGENLPKEFQYENKPQHLVDVKQFAAGKFSVTRAQYEVFVSATGRKSDGCYVWTGSKWEIDLAKDWRNPDYAQDERHPVACISWDDASAYVQWLSKKTGKSYRLLSEAEWEYAARAGTLTYRYWGDDGNMSCAYANGADQTAKAQVPGASSWAVATCNDGYAYTSPVGSFQPNRFGLYDMLGNVAQWTQDCVNQNYKDAPSSGSAWISGDCSKRVLRGGSWRYSPMFLRSAIRVWTVTAEKMSDTGFRVAVDISPVSMGAVIVTPDSFNKAVGGGKPSDSYLGRLRARVKPNIIFSDSQLQSIRGNPAAEVEVIVSPSGQITGMKLTQSSGSTAWDQAVLKAIEKTSSLPRDVNGKIPPKISFMFRPRR
jgi:formylglycine-generating enzyme